MAATRRAILLMALGGLVHVTATASGRAQSRATPGAKSRLRNPMPTIVLGTGAQGLPPAVTEMRAAIIAAVESGDIAELKGAMDLNELKPEFGGPLGTDAIAHLRSQSGDGSGRDILALIGRLLEGGWASIPGGSDIENNRIFVWPHFAEISLAGLAQAELTALEALVGAQQAGLMVAQGRWTGWRLSIGADGVWHMFTQVK